MEQERTFDHVSSQGGYAVMVLLALGCVAVLASVPVLLPLGDNGIATLAMASLALVAFGSFAVGHLVRSGFIWEHQQRRRFRIICRSAGLAEKNPKTGKLVYPRLSRMSGSTTAWNGRITPLTGQTVGQWDKAADAFSLALGASVSFSHNGDGTLSVKVGRRPLESTDARVRELDDATALAWRQWLRSIDVAVAEDGRTYTLPAIDTHLLVVGESGAGKGSVVWSMLIGLVPAIRAGVVRVWGLDPKLLELSIGKGFFYRYAASTEAMVLMLEELVADMMARADSLAGITRKFTPSPDHPMNVIVIDELAYLSSMLPDRKEQARANKALQTLLVLGRASGYMVIGAAQDPRKETLSLRDLYPTRVGLRMKSGMVDLVLGNGARADGAKCDEIPDPVTSDGAGQAYVLGEGSHTPQLVRFHWCSDELIMATASSLDSGNQSDPE